MKDNYLAIFLTTCAPVVSSLMQQFQQDLPLIAVVFSIKYILKQQENMKIYTTLKPHQAL